MCMQALGMSTRLGAAAKAAANKRLVRAKVCWLRVVPIVGCALSQSWHGYSETHRPCVLCSPKLSFAARHY